MTEWHIWHIYQNLASYRRSVSYGWRSRAQLKQINARADKICYSHFPWFPSDDSHPIAIIFSWFPCGKWEKEKWQCKMFDTRFLQKRTLLAKNECVYRCLCNSDFDNRNEWKIIIDRRRQRKKGYVLSFVVSRMHELVFWFESKTYMQFNVVGCYIVYECLYEMNEIPIKLANLCVPRFTNSKKVCDIDRDREAER